jgi:hypothetical protein
MSTLDAPSPRSLDRVLIDSLVNVAPGAEKSVLMFSGGRDSTLAALRMQELGLAPILVTICSPHLIGFERVQMRFREIATHLASGTTWFVVRQTSRAARSALSLQDSR